MGSILISVLVEEVSLKGAGVKKDQTPNTHREDDNENVEQKGRVVAFEDHYTFELKFVFNWIVLDL